MHSGGQGKLARWDQGPRLLPVTMAVSLVVHLLLFAVWEMRASFLPAQQKAQRAERRIPIHLVEGGPGDLPGGETKEVAAASAPAINEPLVEELAKLDELLTQTESAKTPFPAPPQEPPPPEESQPEPPPPPERSQRVARPPSPPPRPAPLMRPPSPPPHPETPPPVPSPEKGVEPRLNQSVEVSDLVSLPPPNLAVSPSAGARKKGPQRSKTRVQLPAMSQVAGADWVPSAAPPGPESRPGVVAVFVHGEITAEDLDHYIETRYGIDLKGSPLPVETKAQLAQRFLNNLVYTRMAVRKAEELGLADRPEVQRELHYLIEDESIAELVASIQGNEIEVTDEEIGQYYQEHQADFKDLELASVQRFIAAVLRTHKARQIFDQYVAELREAADVQVHYERLANPQEPAEQPLFTVNGQAYTVGEWRELVQSLDPTFQKTLQDPKEAHRLVDDLLLRRLLLSAAQELPPSALQERVETLRERILCGLLYQEMVLRKISVSPAELADYYEQVKPRWRTLPRVRVSFVRLPTGSTQEEQEGDRPRIDQVRQVLTEALKDQPDFSTVVAQYASTRPDLESGVLNEGQWIQMGSHGLLDTLTQGQDCPLGLCPILFYGGLQVGDLSEAILFRHRPPQAEEDSVRYYWYLLHLDAREESRIPQLEEIEPFLHDDLWAGKQAAASQNLARELFKAAELKVYPEQIRAMMTDESSSGGTPARRKPWLDSASVDPEDSTPATSSPTTPENPDNPSPG